jgi:hypothetical protein
MSPVFRKKKRWFPPSEFYKMSLCLRCGVCCGATDGHPCTELARQPDGHWHCRTYGNRLGRHLTVTRQEFECSPIKTVIETYGGYACCSYVQEIIRVREEMGQPTDDLGRLEMPES